MRILAYKTGGMVITAALLLTSISGESIAQQAGGGDLARGYPTKPIRWIIDGGAGGLSDTIARTVGQKLTEVWGRPIVHDARPGAGGTIAYELGARAPADGY